MVYYSTKHVQYVLLQYNTSAVYYSTVWYNAVQYILQCVVDATIVKTIPNRTYRNLWGHIFFRRAL